MSKIDSNNKKIIKILTIATVLIILISIIFTIIMLAQASSFNDNGVYGGLNEAGIIIFGPIITIGGGLGIITFMWLIYAIFLLISHKY